MIASWSEKKNRGDASWILLRWDGSLVTAGYQQINRPWAVSWLEAIAAIEGLKLIPISSPKVIVELDSLMIVQLLLGQSKDLTELASFIEEAKTLISK